MRALLLALLPTLVLLAAGMGLYAGLGDFAEATEPHPLAGEQPAAPFYAVVETAQGLDLVDLTDSSPGADFRYLLEVERLEAIGRGLQRPGRVVALELVDKNPAGTWQVYRLRVIQGERATVTVYRAQASGLVPMAWSRFSVREVGWKVAWSALGPGLTALVLGLAGGALAFRGRAGNSGTPSLELH